MKIIIILILSFFYFIKLNNSTPVLYDKYQWSNVNGLVLFGTDFSESSVNYAIINDVEYDCGIANNSLLYQGYKQIFCPPSATISISDGAPFTASVKSLNEISNVRSFYLIKPIMVVMIGRSLVTIGGLTFFGGSFTTSNISIVNLWIGGIPTEVSSIGSTAIYFVSPYISTGPGLYEFLIEIGGLQYKTNVTYINASQPNIKNQYAFTTLENKKVLTFYGYQFTTLTYNIITINGVDYNATAVWYGNSYQIVTLLDEVPLNEGELFYVNARVAGQSFYDTFQFTFFQSLSITTVPVLQTIGGYASIEGYFGNVYTFPTTFGIGSGIALNFFTTISPDTIAFRYPVYGAGTYNLVLNIGGYVIQTNITYETVPPPTLLNNYKLEAGNKLILTGKWYTYFSDNYVIINNETTLVVKQQYVTTSPLPGYDCLSILNFNSVSVGDSFNVTTQVLGQYSNTVNFVYIQSISMNTNQNLNSTGGIVSFTGSFTVSDTSLVKLSINDANCQVYSISPSLITFRYPQQSGAGQRSLVINIGGLDYSTTVQYIVPPSPTISNSYKWSDSNKLIITGTYFSFVNQNYLIINGVKYNTTVPVASDLSGYDQITFSDIDVSTILHEDQIFTVQVENVGLLSNIETFNYVKKISFFTSDTYTLGGIGSEYVTFPGIFGTSNTSIVSLYISDEKCDIISIEPNSITFSYDVLPEKDSSDVILNIGGQEYETLTNVIAPPKPTLLYNYYLSSPNNILVLKGKTFNYKFSNDIILNEQGYSSTPAIYKNGNDEITFNDNSTTESLSNGDSFTVLVNNGLEDSNSITFIYIKSISISTQNLNNTGGIVTFSGEYHITNKTLVSLLIDGSIVEVTEISKNSITFKYPSKSNGQYKLSINIGGFEYSTNVVYVSNPTFPPTPTPTSSDDDTPSISSNLSISLLLTIFTFLLCLL